MRAPQPSPFDTLEVCFRLLTSGPESMSLDGRHVGHGAPARQIPLDELRTLLHHPAATDNLKRAAVQELVRLATEHCGSWTIGLAGVLLPELRKIAGAGLPTHLQVGPQIEADLLEGFRAAMRQSALEAVEFAITGLRLARSGGPGCLDVRPADANWGLRGAASLRSR